MHHVGVVLAGEDIAGAAHVGGELIDLIELAVDDGRADILLAQVADDEIVGFGLGEFRIFQIDAADPEAFTLQPLDQMAGDKTASAANQCLFHLPALLGTATEIR